MICVCGHLERDHRNTGACVAVYGLGNEVAPHMHELVVCPCNDFTPKPVEEGE